MTIGDPKIREDAQRQTPQVASRLLEHTTVVRVESVDALRGLTILLIVFVNDLSPAAPAWMHHIQPPEADGMTLADIAGAVAAGQVAHQPIRSHPCPNRCVVADLT